MIQHPAPIETLPSAAQKAVSGAAPLRAMVSRGMAPLPPPSLVSALYMLAYDPDEKLSSAAKSTLEKLPPPIVEGALASAELPGAVLDDLATRLRTRAGFLERIVQHANTPAETVERIAEMADEPLCELIAVNEQRLLENPKIIEALYMNRALRMSTADRIVELAARNGVELAIPGFKEIAASLANQLIPEPGEVTPADEFFQSAITEAEAIHDGQEDVVERDEEGGETLKEKFRKVEKSLGEMTTSEKMRVALLGNASQRMILVRSSNRVVAMAAITSPRAQESEAIQVSASRQVSEDVLRYVANRREWARLHQVKINLCNNPKTPIATSLRLLPHLRETDLKTLARSKNVPQALRTAVTQLMNKRTQKE